MRPVAFVNRQGGEERRDEWGVSGEPFEFDPTDPDVVKVHYDLSTWNFDQRAELAEVLAESGLPHVWDGEELVVPEVVEAEADAVLERLERELGPFPIVLEEGEPATEFGLDEWSEVDRRVLTESLVDSEIPHRWEGTTVVVAADAEDAVDDLLDAIEAGELLSADEQGAEPPDGALSTIFLAADRLAKDPLDARARTTLLELRGQIDARHPPYAFAPRTWARTVDGVGAIVARIEADAVGPGAPDTDESSDVIGLAQDLRALIRPYV